jgi:ornithine--oxo-acid transaminase
MPCPLAVATAALEVLRDEKLAENAQRMGEVFRQGLAAIPSKGLVQLVRGRGVWPPTLHPFLSL